MFISVLTVVFYGYAREIRQTKCGGYENSDEFRNTVENLTNGQFEVEDLTEKEKAIHFNQAYDIYIEE